MTLQEFNSIINSTISNKSKTNFEIINQKAYLEKILKPFIKINLARELVKLHEYGADNWVQLAKKLSVTEFNKYCEYMLENCMEYIFEKSIDDTIGVIYIQKNMKKKKKGEK